MSFIEKHSDSIFNIKLNVKTNCKLQRVVLDAESLIISLKSKPIQNKANKELINLLKMRLKISSNQIQIISGLKKPDKIIRLNFSEITKEKEILDKLLG